MATFIGYSQQYLIATFFVVFIFSFLFENKVFKNKFSSLYLGFFALFVAYYGSVTIINFFSGVITLVDFANFFIKYLLMPVTIYLLVPMKKKDIIKTIKIIRNIIIISALYGLVEVIFKHNVLDRFILIPGGWTENHTMSGNYKPSSFFLHYNYYGFVLNIGFLLVSEYPIKNKYFNSIIKLLFITQIFIAQSRINRICFLVVSIYYLIKIFRKNTKKGMMTVSFCFGSFLILLFIPGFFNNIQNIIIGRILPLITNGMSEGSIGQRLGTLRNFKYFFLDDPILGLIGGGFGSIEEIFLVKYSFFENVSTADCQLTTFLVEAGVIGTILFSLFIILKLFKKSRTHEDNVIKLLIIVFLIDSITLDIVSNNFLMCVFVSFYSLVEQSKKSHQNIARRVCLKESRLNVFY